jgi:hypothetical protein
MKLLSISDIFSGTGLGLIAQGAAKSVALFKTLALGKSSFHVTNPAYVLSTGLLRKR